MEYSFHSPSSSSIANTFQWIFDYSDVLMVIMAIIMSNDASSIITTVHPLNGNDSEQRILFGTAQPATRAVKQSDGLQSVTNQIAHV